MGGFDHAIDAEGSVWAHYGIFTQPSFAFIDDTGRVEDVTVILGPMGIDGLTATIEEELLDRAAP